MREPPRKGSLRESLLLLYVLKKEKIEHARIRALAQAIIAQEKGKEAFEDYMKEAFPWTETNKAREKSDHIRILMDEVKKGNLSVRPLWQEKVSSRMKHRVVERAATGNEPKKSREEMNKLYEKLAKAPLV